MSKIAVRTLAAFGVLVSFVSMGRAQDAVPLVTGRIITPQGTQTNVGSFPANMVLSSDARYIVVTNAGFRQFLSVLSVDDGHLVSQIEVGKETAGHKAGLYYGLAVGTAVDGKTTIYASRGSEDMVAVYTLDSAGVLADTGRRINDPSPVPENKAHSDVAGVAVNAAGDRLYAVNNYTGAFTDMKGSLAILDPAANRVVQTVSLPGFPFAIAAVNTGPQAGKKVYVSSERDGVVSVVDPQSARVTANVPTGDHPMALLLNRNGTQLFVANAGSDTVSVIDTGSDRVIKTILLRPNDVRGLPGATATGLALSPDERRLYVTLADMNAVALVDLPGGKLAGYIPVGWYPTSVVAAPDGKRIFVASAKGVNIRNPNGKDVGAWGRYIENIIEGTVSMITLPDTGQLTQLTLQTISNNRIRPSTLNSQRSTLPKAIQHVLYIIKENRTYDQVLGDVTQGNGDPSLTMFGKEVTPNLHALAERFVLFDNFYCCAEVSADGWDWSTSGMISEYTARNAPYNYSGRGRVYDFEGQNNGVPVDLLGIPDVARAPGGYIWDQVAKKGLSYRNYGFYLSFAGPGDRGPEGKPIAISNTPNKRVLVGHTDEDFLQFDMTYADSELWKILNAPCPKQQKEYGSHHASSRFAEWKREFDDYVKNGNLPRFAMIRLPRDHTSGTAPGLHSPRAMVADNDFAVGQIADAVSHSPYWKSTAIFVIEDDAQNGFDHVDAHRSIAFVISPYVKKSTVDHRFYNTDSMLRTMELLLGVPPMCQYDGLAAPFDIFSPRPDNAEPYTAILPSREIAGEVNGERAYRAQDSARLNFRIPDAVPDDTLNDILWHAVMGVNTPKPPIQHGLRLRPVKDDD